MFISFSHILLCPSFVSNRYEVIFLEAAYGTPNKELYSNGAGNTFKFNPMQGLGNNEVTSLFTGSFKWSLWLCCFIGDF